MAIVKRYLYLSALSLYPRGLHERHIESHGETNHSENYLKFVKYYNGNDDALGYGSLVP